MSLLLNVILLLLGEDSTQDAPVSSRKSREKSGKASIGAYISNCLKSLLAFGRPIKRDIFASKNM